MLCPVPSGTTKDMNANGNPGTLTAAHPGNTNAVRYGVYSPRFIERGAAEIVAQLTESLEFSAAQRIAVEQVGRCIAILENIDRDLSERGVTDKRGQPRSLLNYRSRSPRELDQVAGPDRPRNGKRGRSPERVGSSGVRRG